MWCVQEMESAAARASLPVDASGALDYSGDFFGEKVFLTVSGQLNGMCRREGWWYKGVPLGMEGGGHSHFINQSPVCVSR
jgi:hypothetical protein